MDLNKKLLSSRGQLKEFFSSFVWLDIKMLFEEAQAMGVDQISSFDMDDMNTVNILRGKLDQLKEFIDLESLMMTRVEEEMEEENDDAENTD